jgi:cytoskeletal protein CcmA (bactofilin family)
MGKEDLAVNTIIGKGATFDGLLEITGGLRVDGAVKGKIVSADVVLIGPSGTVDADIEAKETIIGGTVRGNVKAPDKIELQAKSQVEGDIVTYSLVVEQGASFHGNCQMRKDQARTAAQAHTTMADGKTQTQAHGQTQMPGAFKDSDSLLHVKKNEPVPTFQKSKA